MDKLKKLIKKFKDTFTNDPAAQRKLVRVLEQMAVVLEENRHNSYGGENR